ncbi:MAG: hypothetical protein KDA62_05360 [Planctomycetales bacterium]|nr:hypothetical protein [Planctomycetales bacterium]
MRRGWRWMIAAVSAALLGLLLIFAQMDSRERQAANEVAARQVADWSNDGCRQCHEAVWDEWQASRHAGTWTNPQVRAAFQHFGHDRQCESCHAAEPILFRPPDAAPRLRPASRDSGVDCLVCHLRRDGTVAAARTVVDAPCRPVSSAELVSSQFCGACHTAIYRDWQESRFREENKTCQACHMPADDARPGGRGHLCTGGYDESLVRSGVRMQFHQQADELIVEVTNHATGHNFPGERHNRVLMLQIVQHNADGETLDIQQRTIKGITPFRGESSAEQIRAGETYTDRVEVVAGAATARVELLLKHFPWEREEQALVVHEAELRVQ